MDFHYGDVAVAYARAHDINTDGDRVLLCDLVTSLRGRRAGADLISALVQRARSVPPQAGWEILGLQRLEMFADHGYVWGVVNEARRLPTWDAGIIDNLLQRALEEVPS